jgi:Uma2 family endonuclease
VKVRGCGVRKRSIEVGRASVPPYWSGLEGRIMVSNTTVKKVTPQEYLELEESATEKHEYRDGEIVKIAGGTTNHNAIVVALVAYLFFGLQGQDVRVFSGDVRLWISSKNTFTYPDVMVVCGDVGYHDNRQDTIVNPMLIIEVLSNSTKGYDKTDKFDAYRSLPSFTEYIAIDQYRYAVEQYVKTDDNQWVITYHESENSVLELSSIDVAIKLTDIYANVNFE